MQDVQLYEPLWGLSEPWYVAGVRRNLAAQEVEVSVAVRDQVWGCPPVRRADACTSVGNPALGALG
jgi:hypothetical protein